MFSFWNAVEHQHNRRQFSVFGVPERLWLLLSHVKAHCGAVFEVGVTGACRRRHRGLCIARFRKAVSAGAVYSGSQDVARLPGQIEDPHVRVGVREAVGEEELPLASKGDASVRHKTDWDQQHCEKDLGCVLCTEGIYMGLVIKQEEILRPREIACAVGAALWHQHPDPQATFVASCRQVLDFAAVPPPTLRAGHRQCRRSSNFAPLAAAVARAAAARTTAATAEAATAAAETRPAREGGRGQLMLRQM